MPHDHSMLHGRLRTIFTGVALVAAALLCQTTVAQADEAQERLLLLANLKERTTHVDVGVKKPFDVWLVAERDTDESEISTVVFQLDVPDGIVIVGEELLVESLIALGTTKTGINLAFHCVAAPQVQIMRLRMIAMRPLDKATIRLNPEKRTNFLGLVACKNESYEKWEVDPATLTVSAK